MRDAVICMPLRTPVGRYGGVLKDVDAETLAATVIKAVVERSGLDPALIDDCILGQGYPSGESPAIGRTAVLRAGLPIEVPGDAARPALRLRPAGDLLRGDGGADRVADVVLAGGVESMSNVEFYATGLRDGQPRATSR